MDYLLTFQNTHDAIRSEKQLIDTNIPVTVMPLPTSLGDFCGICLRVEDRNFTEGRKQLLHASIPIKQIFMILETKGSRNYKLWNG